MTDSPAIGSPSRGRRRTSSSHLRIARFALPCFLLLSCESDVLPFREIDIEGQAHSIERLSGVWYLDDGTAAIAIRTRAPARLSIRLDPVFRLTRAWVDTGDLYLELRTEGRPPEIILFRKLKNDHLYLVSPGDATSSPTTCDPGLRRYAAPWMADPRVREIRELPERIYDHAIDRMAEIL